MSAAPRLRVVDAIPNPDTGEVVTSKDLVALQAEVEKLRTDLKMAQRDVKRKNRQIAELERDRARERLEHPDRELIERVASYWHRKCKGGDPRVNPLSPVRFDAVAGLVEMTRIEFVEVDGKVKRQRVPMYEPEAFREAIDGAAFDAYRRQRKNGSWQRFDDLELIFRDSKQMEEFISRAPVRTRT